MTASLIFLGIIMVTIVVWLVRQTINTKPWVGQAVGEDIAELETVTDTTKKFALFSFLAVATSFFALFFSAYSMRMSLSDWDPLAEPRMLWLNTAVLVLSSVAMQVAHNAAQQGQLHRLRIGATIGAVMALLFLMGQLLAWQQLIEAGYYLQSNAAYAFFYLFTGLHGIHLLGGLWVLSNATVAAWRGGFDPGAIRQSVELCKIYWHFLLVVWLVLYWLMLTT